MQLLDLATLLVVGSVLAACFKGLTWMIYGRGPKAGHKGWKGVYYVTLWAQPIAVGALIGWPKWLPAPEFMGKETAGRVLWYALAGIFSSTAYDAVASVIKQKAAIREKRAGGPPSIPVPELENDA